MRGGMLSRGCARNALTGDVADTALKFSTGEVQGGHSAAARSKCVAASLSSATERGPASQAPHSPLSTSARIWQATPLSGATLTTLADSTHTLIEPLVVPPLRLGHLGALILYQHVEGLCRGPSPALISYYMQVLPPGS